MRTVIVCVRQEDIDLKRYCRSTECPVALALERATGERWSVGPHGAVRLGGILCEVHLPPDAVRFIHLFDNQFPVEPITFDVEVPR